MNQARGSCLCGDLQFLAQLPSQWVAHCHCTLCQRSNGAGFVTWVGMEASRCEIRDPQRRLAWHSSSPGAERGFCSHCGSPLFFRSSRWPGELHITRANFIDPVDREPRVHVFWDSHVAWIQLDAGDGLERQDAPQVD